MVLAILILITPLSDYIEINNNNMSIKDRKLNVCINKTIFIGKNVNIQSLKYHIVKLILKNFQI